jgi:hypothetical protein
MYETTIAFSVQWIDAVLGVGRVADLGSVTATAKDVLGNTVVIDEDSIVISTDDDTGATYTVPAFSIKGIEGTHITVDWAATFGGESAAVTKTEYFRPLSPRPGAVSVLAWQVPDEYVTLFYEVVEVDIGGDDLRVVGTSDIPTLIDYFPFTDDTAALATRYVVRAAKTADPDEEGNPYEFTDVHQSWSVDRTLIISRVSQDMCLVRGQAATPDGRAARGSVVFRVSPKDLPRVTQGLYLRGEDVNAPLTASGHFGAYLMQGALIEVRLTSAGLHGRFAVPLADEALLKDIPIAPTRKYTSVE